MPVSTPAARPLAYLLVALCALLTLAGCQSTRPTYSFQPRSTTAPSLPTDSALVTPVAPVTATPGTAAVKTVSHGQLVRVMRPRAMRQQLRRAVAQATAAAPVRRTMLRPTHRAAPGTQAVQEVGLGTTVLGVLGLIVGPIALIGLLIWGGPVWATLLGLAALAVLVAYIDPFR